MEDGAEVEDRLGGAGRGVYFWGGEYYLNPPSTILPKKGGIFFDFGGMFLLELHLDLVFRLGIGRYFSGISPTHTEGKLDRDVSVSYIWGEPLFPSKGGFRPLFDGPSPPFEGNISSRQIYKKEFPQNFTKWSSRQILQHKNTKPNILTGKCR